MGGALGEQVEAIAAGFNEMQDDFTVVPVYKGDYTENMTTAIAAFRAGEQPHIVQVFEVGTATMMAAEGAVKPVQGIMDNADIQWNSVVYVPAVKSYYTAPEGDMLSLPFTSSKPVMWYNRELLDAAGISGVLQTRDERFAAAEALQANGHECAFSFGWQSWVMARPIWRGTTSPSARWKTALPVWAPKWRSPRRLAAAVHLGQMRDVNELLGLLRRDIGAGRGIIRTGDAAAQDVTFFKATSGDLQTWSQKVSMLPVGTASYSDIGERRRRVCRAFDPDGTQATWAARHGFNRTQLVNWESGARRIPVDSAEKLVQAYG